MTTTADLTAALFPAGDDARVERPDSDPDSDPGPDPDSDPDSPDGQSPAARPALAHALVAEWEGDHAGPAIFGMAVWFVTFSTWTGRHGIWLEDLFVDPSARGLGAGRALLEELAAECRRRGYARLDWGVLDWNTPAQAFYRSLGAKPMDEWTPWRVDGESLLTLGTLDRPQAEPEPGE